LGGGEYKEMINISSKTIGHMGGLIVIKLFVSVAQGKSLIACFRFFSSVSSQPNLFS
jgi:hypothetical protein